MSRPSWIAKFEAGRDAEERLAVARTRASLAAAAALLRDQFSATEVWVFGSFGPGGAPAAHSDVDLLVSGVGETDLCRASVRLMDLLGRSVDLVAAERARPEVVAEARRYGEALLGP